MNKRNAILHAAGCLCAVLMAGCGGDGMDLPAAPMARACVPGGVCVSTVAGSGESGNVDGTADTARFSMPHAVVIDAASNIHVADYGNNTLTRLIANGSVTTPQEDLVVFPLPANQAVDAAGNRYLADSYHNRILKVTPAGETTVLAGTGWPGDTDGDGSAASFSMPAGLVFDAQGALYVADMGSRKIRKIVIG